MRLIIYAPTVHAGGGRSLLLALFAAIERGNGQSDPVLAFLDRRLEVGLKEGSRVRVLLVIEPTLLGRLRAERMLAKQSQSGDVILCFGNLPPIFRVKGYAVTYVQNTYMTGTDPGVIVPWSARMKFMLARLWLRLTRDHTDLFLVQTDSMRDRLLKVSHVEEARVKTAPFFEQTCVTPAADGTLPSQRWDFGYVALPGPHKNHYRLIETFVLLAQRGMAPSLVVTVPRELDAELADHITHVNQTHGVRITNLGAVPHERIGDIYQMMGCLIFPSLSETVGLPLLEAQSYKLPIIAAERDYVRDVVEPAETFDPESSHSIMRAVLRFLGKPDHPLRIQGAEEFLANLVQMVDRLQGGFRS